MTLISIEKGKESFTFQFISRRQTLHTQGKKLGESPILEGKSVVMSRISIREQTERVGNQKYLKNIPSRGLRNRGHPCLENCSNGSAMKENTSKIRSGPSSGEDGMPVQGINFRVVEIEGWLLEKLFSA